METTNYIIMGYILGSSLDEFASCRPRLDNLLQLLGAHPRNPPDTAFHPQAGNVTFSGKFETQIREFLLP